GELTPRAVRANRLDAHRLVQRLDGVTIGLAKHERVLSRHDPRVAVHPLRVRNLGSYPVAQESALDLRADLETDVELLVAVLTLGGELTRRRVGVGLYDYVHVTSLTASPGCV